jgi:hypothetical protein
MNSATSRATTRTFVGGSPSVCADIAESLGQQTVVLMARHGVVNEGSSVRQVVSGPFILSRSRRAYRRPSDRPIKYLSPGEVKSAGNLVGAQIDRGWDHWSDASAGGLA